MTFTISIMTYGTTVEIQSIAGTIGQIWCDTRLRKRLAIRLLVRLCLERCAWHLRYFSLRLLGP